MATSPKIAPLALLLLVFAAGCGAPESPRTPAQPTGNATVADWFPMRLGAVAFEAQLAIRIDEQQRGLMFRNDLGQDQGMFFLYAQDQALSFWMRNTPLPLDVAFFTADGTLTEIASMQPHDETPVRSARSDIRFALEMHQGWFRRNGIAPGASVDTALLRQAIAARGYPADRFLPAP
jgi:uncharacterized membrane protein (UPF0127 family)